MDLVASSGVADGVFSADPLELARHGHQASLADGLDFVNTLSYDKGLPYDRLTDAPAAVNWLQRHSLLHAETAASLIVDVSTDDASAARLLQRIQKVRSALRELLDAAVERRPAAGSALREVNKALRATYVIELVPATDGVSLDHRHEGDPSSGALARLSEAIARELTQSDKDRLRICENDDCRWVFRDGSPAGRRKWCDMSSCGNRAKAARHRERQRQKAETSPESLPA